MFDEFISTIDINESYVFKEVLGQYIKPKAGGAFAEVRRAIYIEEDRSVAIKCIDKYCCSQIRKRIKAEDLNIYKNECEIMFYLEHPNIIEVYEVYDNPDYFYIVMEYMEGGELCDPNNSSRCSTQSKIAQIIKTLTDALDYCHSKNIVHRDIKPQNILWSTKDEEAVLKIADFGFAKISHDSLMTTACGTPMYISPEILNGQPYDRSVDFWSLGIILYILLSGRSPFEADDQNQLFQLIKNGKVSFSDNAWKYVSTSAKDLIQRLLQKNPKQRYKAQDIRRHPWVNNDHIESFEYTDRFANMQSFDANRKIEKLRTIINLTINDIRNESIMEEESGEGSSSK